MNIAQKMLTTFNDDKDLLKKITTGGESWVYGYDIEAKIPSIPMKACRRAKTEESPASLVKEEGFAHF